MSLTIPDPVPAFSFTVILIDVDPNAVGAASFGTPPTVNEGGSPPVTIRCAEVSGLNAESETEEYREGGRNAGPHRFPKWGKFPNLVLKRGVTGDMALWDWYNQVQYGTGPLPRKNGIILLNDRGGTGPGPRPVVAAWFFENGLPERCQGPSLNAKSNEIAIETLEIAHERLVRLGPALVPGATTAAGA